jgi:hypothetical protein
MNNFKKEEFLHIMQRNFYKLFYIPFERLEHLFYVEPIYNKDSKKDIDFTKIKEKKWMFTKDEFVAIQGALDNQMYGEEIVPVSFYTIGCVSNGKLDYERLRYIGQSVDDSSQGFWLTPIGDNKIEDAYKIVFQYLYENPFFQYNHEFIEWFDNKCGGKFIIEYDFN